MKKFSAVTSVTLLLSACVAPNPDQVNGLKMAETHYQAATKNSLSVECADKQSCDKAFSLVKAYIGQRSEMRVQQSDDTTISTFSPVVYVPHDKAFAENLGMISLSALKMPGKGDSATITLKVACSGLSDEVHAASNPDRHINSDPAFKHVCMDRIAGIHEEFKTFIESRMK